MRFFLTFAAFSPLFAQTLSQPVPLLPADPLAAFSYSGPAAGEKSGKAEIADVSGMPFDRAWRLSTISLPEKGFNEWDIRIRARGAAPVAKDDVILATFWLRCIQPDGGECVTRLNVEQNGTPYTKSIALPYIGRAAWKQYKVMFRMAESYGPGGYYIDFWMGQLVQVMEVGGVTVNNYGQGVTAADLGVDALYEGASPDAPWRAAAEERISKIRKASLVVVAVDPRGNPVPGAEIRARMTRHAFGWGTAVAADQLLGTSPDSEKYRNFILDNFNMVVLENDLKWPQWESNRQRALNALHWLRDHGITKLRGHNLIWPSWQYMPANVQPLASDPAALRNRILDHIRDEASDTRGLLEDWDVLNEAYTNRQVQDILGDAEMAAWFQAAKESDPEARLFINDYSILSANGADFAHRNGYARIISYLDSLGAPVEGIGMQGHFASPTEPEIMLSILDRFALFKRPIEITEYDFVTPDEHLQAQFTRDLMTVAFSHPSLSNFLMWGFWEGRHWKPQGAMIRRDWSSKPMHDAWREMIYSRWWTDETGIAPHHGALYFHAFKGAYEITVKAGGKTVSVPYQLSADGSVIQVVVP